MNRKLDFLIIGAHKAASTSLYHYLRQHPAIFLPEKVDENRFFTKEEFYRQGPRYLAPYYKDYAGEKLVGGKNVHVMYLSGSLRRIVRYNPKIQLICILRNPIDRAYSAYWFARRNGWEQTETFEAALKLERERMEGGYDERTELTYLSHGHYASQIEEVFDIFGRDAVRIYLTDDLSSDASKTVEDALAWLGVGSISANLDVSERHNTSRMPRLQSVQRFLMARDAWYRELARSLIPYPVRIAIQTHVIDRLRSLNDEEFSYPPMQETTRENLREHFRPHNRRLAELINRDLSHWT